MSGWMGGGVLLALLAVACSREAPVVAGRPADSAALSAMPDATSGGMRAGPIVSPRHSDTVLLAAWSRDYRRALRRHAQVLAGLDDGRSQLAAAWLLRMAAEGGTSGEDDAAFAALLVRAGDLAPDDPLVAWLERTSCPSSQRACRPDQALARLQTLDPDNVAASLFTLNAAYARGDHGAVDTTLAHAARASRYNDRWNEAGRFFDAALAGVALPARDSAVLAAQRRQMGASRPPTDAELRATHAIAMASAVGWPGLQALTRSCRGDAVAASSTRRSACLSVFARMAESDTLLARSVGLGSAVRLTAGTPANVAWREQLRHFHWLRSEAALRFATLPPDYVERLWREGEVATLQSLLAAAGRPVTPPPGWLPDSAELRSLITTGFPPPKG